MKINKRLTRLSSYIEDNSNVIDVGCDHALLCIYLVKEKNNIKCIASDIKEGPLLQAKRNVEEFGLDKSIKIKQGDGIETIEDYIDTIVISGMGGKTIVDILLKNKNKLSNIKKIILSPNNDFYLVRRTISNIGFKIKQEEVVFDKNKFYSIIVFEPGKETYKEKDLLYGINLLNNNDLLNYYRYLYNGYEYKIKKLPFKYIFKKIDLILKKNRLKRLMKRL